MHKKIIISSESSNLHSTKRFEEEILKLKMIPIVQNPYNSCLTSLQKIKHFKDIHLFLHRTSGIRYDDFDLLMAQNFQHHHIKVTNSPQSIRPFREKDSQIFYLNAQGFNTIPTFVFRGEPTENIFASINKAFKTNEYILKMNRGNGGIGVQYIKTQKSLQSILETFHALKDQKMILQPFLQHKKEYRLFVTHKLEMYLIEKEISPSDFRGNKKRSTAKLISKIPNAVKTLGEDLARTTKLDYMGVDFFYNNNEIIILEVNAVPGFETIEKITGKNIAREIILL